MMKYRTLGRTGLPCSEIGFGTWAFASNAYGDVSEQASMDAVRAALDTGINFFDTAPLYGTLEEDGIAERILGKALGGDRDKVILSTKFGRNPSLGGGPQFNARRARESVEESLQRLGTDRIDILFFHSPFSPDEIHDDVWEALGDLKARGKIGHVGHSISMFEQTESMARQWAEERRIDVIQVVASLMNRQAGQLIAELGDAGIGVVAREALGNGFLTGSVTRDTVFPANNLNFRYSREEISGRVDYVESLRFLVRGEIRTLPQAALRWVLDQPGVSLVLSGARSRAEILDGAAASEASPFTAEELRKATALHRRDFSAA